MDSNSHHCQSALNQVGLGESVTVVTVERDTQKGACVMQMGNLVSVDFALMHHFAFIIQLLFC